MTRFSTWLSKGLVLLSLFLITGCIKKQLVVCRWEIYKCISQQLPKDVIIVDIVKVDRNIYEIKYRERFFGRPDSSKLQGSGAGKKVTE